MKEESQPKRHPESVTLFGNKVMDPTFGTTGVLIRRGGMHRENAIW